MKEHGMEKPPESAGRVLKSLLKKPGQTKAKSQKNRVVINEKLNEFFAADYIILIKEECCADYEEECDYCCQEHEMIRLGNCKECRAELNLHFSEEPHFVVDEVDIDDAIRARAAFQGDEDEEAEDEEDEDEDEEDEEEELEDKRTSLRKLQQRQHHQRETLSPPEGYKDLCSLANDLQLEDQEHCAHQPVCAECDYYQRTAETELEKVSEDVKTTQDTTPRHSDDGNIQQTIDQAQQTTPDLHQRYLVETITMTTVTERRIVREISEEESTRNQNVDEVDHTRAQNLEAPLSNCEGSSGNEETNPGVETDLDSSDNAKLTDKRTNSKDPAEAGELSLSLKFGNVSLVANSLKPNSAVRQLFPDQRFISPPPAPTKGGSLSISDSMNDDSADAEAQKFLITTESLRLFDSVKRSKMTGARSDSSESDSSSIKRTIERNALRRSLICKLDTTSRKKNLRSKDLTLEERIRQLTCVDADDETEAQRTIEGAVNELPARTSPSGEERPNSSLDTNFGSNNGQPLTYRKITDLFIPKKSNELNLPDIGLGNKSLDRDYGKMQKMNSDARKQFLASLAPLSCVASTAVDSREDYYRISSKVSINREHLNNRNSDSYSLEDIETALRGNERIYNCTGAPPDVTRGTPTSLGPDESDRTGDELLAFVEQDKSRTERIKRRYNESTDTTNGEATYVEKKASNEEDDDDDELNDYGFNKRPSVRGIKPQFSSSSDIVHQIRARSISNVFPDRVVMPATRSFELGPELESSVQSGLDNSINRLNGTQKIDDVYQTVAETTLSVQGTLERGSYIESTLPRSIGRAPIGDNAVRYTERENGIHYQDQGGRMLRIATGADGVATYGTLPTKSRRQPTYANYHCNVFPTTNGKCYRTMYFVPCDGLSDPTYQNLQRILPAHSSPNYANHIERYPYPRDVRLQQQSGYYVRPNGQQLIHNQPSELHVHVHQSEELHMTPSPNINHSVQQLHPLQLQHQQQIAGYNIPSIPGYSVIAPVKGAAPAYSYQVHLGRGNSDVQMQTITLPATLGTSCGQSMSTFTGTTQVLGTVSSSSLTSSSVLSSPTKMTQPRKESCPVAERGVPEGAVSAPAHDFSQSNSMTGSFLAHSANVPPPNTQNSVYYAMNV